MLHTFPLLTHKYLNIKYIKRKHISFPQKKKNKEMKTTNREIIKNYT